MNLAKERLHREKIKTYSTIIGKKNMVNPTKNTKNVASWKDSGKLLLVFCMQENMAKT